MIDLRQRLIDAQLARGNIYHTNEEKADDALAVVVDWLRSEAAELRRRREETTSAPRHRFLLAQIAALENAATASTTTAVAERDQLRAERDAARDELGRLRDDAVRWHNDSTTLNTVAYRIAEALADRKGEERYVGDPLEQVARLIAERDALLDLRDKAVEWHRNPYSFVAQDVLHVAVDALQPTEGAQP